MSIENAASWAADAVSPAAGKSPAQVAFDLVATSVAMGLVVLSFVAMAFVFLRKSPNRG